MLPFRSLATILGHAHHTTHRAEESPVMSMVLQNNRWTLAEVHALPEDGNRYELVYGELWVTPGPTHEHEVIAARLARVLDPYVAHHRLGLTFRPQAVFRVGSDVEVSPDLQVRSPNADIRGSWETVPLPLLVVEILSPSTRGRDLGRKRDLYLGAGIEEYWVIDPEHRTITSLAPSRAARVYADVATWLPTGVQEALEIDVRALFV